MKKISSSLRAALAFSLALGTAAPAMAAPAFVPAAPVASSDIVQVQSRQVKRAERRENRAERRAERRQDRREARFERRGNYAYYNGRRGYRERRAGYRLYNGFWFPPAAFIAGAIIGGAISQPALRSGSSAHVQWCYDRWRSYRASDNTYQPLNGGRRYCVSPYS
jgi:hypothetical protein